MGTQGCQKRFEYLNHLPIADRQLYFQIFCWQESLYRFFKINFINYKQGKLFNIVTIIKYDLRPFRRQSSDTSIKENAGFLVKIALKPLFAIFIIFEVLFIQFMLQIPEKMLV